MITDYEHILSQVRSLGFCEADLCRASGVHQSVFSMQRKEGSEPLLSTLRKVNAGLEKLKKQHCATSLDAPSFSDSTNAIVEGGQG